MSNEELEIELVDDSTDEGEDTNDSNEETLSSDDESESSDEDDTTSTKSKKSNWKKMAKLNKALMAENKKLKAAQNREVGNDDDDDDFEDEDEEELGTFDKTEFRFFTIENPEAKPFAKEIEKVVLNHPKMSFEDALLLVKAKQPKTSVSSNDFSTKSANTKIRKTISQITAEEALKLPPEQYLKWARATWVIKK